MHKLFKFICLLLVPMLIFSAGQHAFSQQQKIKKPAKKHSKRDSLQQKVLQRDSIMRSFKQSDGSMNALIGKIEDYNSSSIQINADLTRGFDTLDISQSLPTFERRLALLNKAIDKSTTLGYLVTIRDMIDHAKDQMDSWDDLLNAYNDQLDKIRGDLAAFKADTALRQAPADSGLREKYLIQINQIEQKWQTVDHNSKKALIRIGLLTNRVSAISILLIDMDEKIDLRIHQFTLNAMTNEYGFIWDMHKENRSNRVDSALVQTYRLNYKLYKYFLISKANYYGHLACIILLLAFFAWIFNSKRKIARVKENYESIFYQTRYIVKHPYIATLLVVSVLAPYFYDHPAQVFTQTMLLLMMGCIGVLIKNLWPKPLFRLWTTLFVLAVLFTVSHLVILITYTDRIILLLLAATAMYVSFRFLKYLKQSPGDYPPYMEVILKLFIALQGVSILLNIFGRLSLAKIIGTMAIFNLCLAMGLYLLIQILMEALFLQLEANKNLEAQSITSYFDFNVLQKKFKDTVVKVTAILWLVALAKYLSIDDYLYDQASDFLDHPYKFSKTDFTIKSLLTFFIVIWISGLVARVISYFYDFSAQQQPKLSPQAKKTRSSILLIRLTVFVIGFFVAITAAGIPLDQVTLIIGALGVGIGFGLQNIVNNLVSGIILAFEKPIQVGDIIEVGGKSGTIKEIGIRSSKINCGDGSELIVPNGDLISQHVVNWTLTDNSRRIELIVGVAYGSDLVKVEALLRNIVTTRDDIMKSPAPLVFLHNFNDSSIDYRLLFWAADIGTWLTIKSGVMSQIYLEFAAEGIEIPNPKRDVQVFFPEGDLNKLKEALKEEVKPPPTENRPETDR